MRRAPIARRSPAEAAMLNQRQLNPLVYDRRAFIGRNSTAVTPITPSFLTSLLSRFIKDGEATTTVEFGMLAAPFVAALLAILQTALVFFASQTLETATATSARLIFT